MKCIFFAIGLNLLCFFKSYSQVNITKWLFKDENYDLVFNFENARFKIDTTLTTEGNIYLFTFPGDSSYIRMNYIFANAKFECCSIPHVYQELECCKKNGVVDRRGVVAGATLYWREIHDRNLDIVYNNCPQEKREFFNHILNGIVLQLTR